jgi:hypothetical protein
MKGDTVKEREFPCQEKEWVDAALLVFPVLIV